jgi:hypothetical protein
VVQWTEPVSLTFHFVLRNKRFQRRRFFRNQPIRNKNCLWWPCLQTDRDEMSNLYRGPSINASYQVSDSFGQEVSEEKIFRNWPIRNKNCLWWPFFLTNWAEMSSLYQVPSIYASYKVSVHLAMRFQRRTFFRKRPIRNKNCLWWPCLLSYWDEMNNIYRTFNICFLPSFGSFGYTASEDKIFFNRPIRNKNCLWRPCLLANRAVMSNLYRGPSIDASYQVSDFLVKGFQRRRLKCEKFTEGRRRTTDGPS